MDKSLSPNSFNCTSVLLSTFAFALFSAADAVRRLMMTEVRQKAARAIHSEKAEMCNVPSGGK